MFPSAECWRCRHPSPHHLQHRIRCLAPTGVTYQRRTCLLLLGKLLSTCTLRNVGKRDEGSGVVGTVSRRILAVEQLDSY